MIKYVNDKFLVMKRVFFILLISGGFATVFSSCKKDYTCTCTTTVGGVSTSTVHDLTNQTYRDADEACEKFEEDNGVSITNCHL